MLSLAFCLTIFIQKGNKTNATCSCGDALQCPLLMLKSEQNIFSLVKTSPLSIFKASFEEANWPEKYFCKVINMTRARRWWNVNLNLLLRQKKLYPPKWEQNKQIKKAPHKSCNFISLRDFLHQRFRKLDEVNLKYKTILSG